MLYHMYIQGRVRIQKNIILLKNKFCIYLILIVDHRFLSFKREKNDLLMSCFICIFCYFKLQVLIFSKKAKFTLFYESVRIIMSQQTYSECPIYLILNQSWLTLINYSEKNSGKNAVYVKFLLPVQKSHF